MINVDVQPLYLNFAKQWTEMFPYLRRNQHDGHFKTYGQHLDNQDNVIFLHACRGKTIQIAERDSVHLQIIAYNC
jgi:hypothetical protein